MANQLTGEDWADRIYLEIAKGKLSRRRSESWVVRKRKEARILCIWRGEKFRGSLSERQGIDCNLGHN